MAGDKNVSLFLSQYDKQVFDSGLKLRDIVFFNLPGIIEQPGIPAKMIAYVLGQKYAEMICTIIRSKKGLKLGFYKGTELPDPDNFFPGTGKISRYVEIKSVEQVNSSSLRNLIKSGLTAYRQRINR